MPDQPQKFGVTLRLDGDPKAVEAAIKLLSSRLGDAYTPGGHMYDSHKYRDNVRNYGVVHLPSDEAQHDDITANRLYYIVVRYSIMAGQRIFVKRSPTAPLVIDAYPPIRDAAAKEAGIARHDLNPGQGYSWLPGGKTSAIDATGITWHDMAS